MVLYVIWHGILLFLYSLQPQSLLQRSPLHKRHVLFSLTCKRSCLKKLLFLALLLRASLTNMAWAQNRAHVTSLSFRKLIVTLTEKPWAPRPSTLYLHSSCRDARNQPDWRVRKKLLQKWLLATGAWGFAVLLCRQASQLQPVVARVGAVLTRRKSYAATECGGMCCRVWLLCQRNMRFLHLLLICLVFIIPLSPPLPVQGEWYEAPEHTAIFKQELDHYVEISKIFQLVTSHKFSTGTEDPFSQLHMPFPQRIYERAFRRQFSQTHSKQSVSCKPAIRLNVSTIKSI